MSHRLDLLFPSPTSMVTGRRQPNRLRATAAAERTRSRPSVTATMMIEAEEAAEEEEVGGTAAVATNGSKAYALFTRNLLSGLIAYTIDSSSGTVTAKRSVRGPFAKYMQLYYGEGTRLLPWDPVSAKFYLADVDLGGGGVDNASSPVVLFSIDPSDGSSDATHVSGCSGYPIGLAWDAPKGALMLTTQGTDDATGDAIVRAFAVDPRTGRAESLGTTPRGYSETSASFYAAYVSHAEGGVAYRVGHKKVSSGEELGVAVFSPGASVVQWTDLAWTSHGWPATVHSAADADGASGLTAVKAEKAEKAEKADVGEFVGLAPRTGGGGKVVAYDLVAWPKAAPVGGVSGPGVSPGSPRRGASARSQPQQQPPTYGAATARAARLRRRVARRRHVWGAHCRAPPLAAAGGW